MLKIVSFAVAIYLALCALLYFKQRALLYFPSAESQSSHAEAWWLESAQHRLKIWRLNSGAPGILYFGGNAEAAENNIDEFRQMFPSTMGGSGLRGKQAYPGCSAILSLKH